MRDRASFFWFASAVLWSIACGDPSGPSPSGQGGAGTPGSAGSGASSGTTAIGGGGASAGTGSGGGSAGTPWGGAGGSGGGAGGGGNAASGGGAGGGAAGGPADSVPWRPLEVTAPKARHEHSFKPSDADSEVSFNDETQKTIFDNRAAKLVGKLVLPFGGLGSTAGSFGGQGEFCAKRGFHVLAIAAYEDFDILIGDPDFSATRAARCSTAKSTLPKASSRLSRWAPRTA